MANDNDTKNKPTNVSPLPRGSGTQRVKNETRVMTRDEVMGVKANPEKINQQKAPEESTDKPTDKPTVKALEKEVIKTAPVTESAPKPRSVIPLGYKPDIRTIRKISPLGMRVVLRIRRDGNQTDAGLYLPEGAKESMQESLLGEVIEVASAMDEDFSEGANISGVPLGALVLIPKRVGVRVPWDEELRIVETKEILAIVNEVTLS